ncbi:hypothetical protein Tco_1325917, partial [Tanacetum coccineum]
DVTPLFNSMLVPPTEDEGEVSERPSESQPTPSPTHPSKDQPKSQPNPSPRPSSSIPIPDSNLEGFGGNHGEIKDLKAQIKQLKKKAMPVINHHKPWFRAARLKKQQKQKDMKKSKKKRSVSKQGRKAVKSSKGAPLICTDIAKITRKQPRPGKNEHETDRVHKSWKFSSKRSTKSQQWSNHGKLQNEKTLKISKTALIAFAPQVRTLLVLFM